MNKAVKMDIMHGPLSYLGGDGMVEKLGACGEYHFAGARPFINHIAFEAGYNNTIPYRNEFLTDIRMGDIDEALEGEDFENHVFDLIQKKTLDNLVNARRGFNKRIKKWIEDKEFSVIYFFHPVDIVIDAKDYRKLEAEAKKKSIKLVSVYHTLKDCKVLSDDESIQITKDYYDSIDCKDAWRKQMGTFYGAMLHYNYKWFIRHYNKHEKKSDWDILEEAYEKIMASEKNKGGE